MFVFAHHMAVELLGREFSQRRETSERTAQLVDDEVKRFIDEAYEKARQILMENRDLLERIALTLLDRETIDGADLDLILRGEELPPRPPVAPIGPTVSVPSSKSAPARPAAVLGAPPAEPAGA